MKCPKGKGAWTPQRREDASVCKKCYCKLKIFVFMEDSPCPHFCLWGSWSLTIIRTWMTGPVTVFRWLPLEWATHCTYLSPLSLSSSSGYFYFYTLSGTKSPYAMILPSSNLLSKPGQICGWEISREISAVAGNRRDTGLWNQTEDLRVGLGKKSVFSWEAT